MNHRDKIDLRFSSKKGALMSWLWRGMLILLLSISFHAQSNEDLEAPCGMTYDDEGVLVVEEFNGDICENDIAMQMLYLLYADILDDGIWKAAASPFMHEEAKESEFIQFATNTIGISTFVTGLMDIVAALGWFILAPIIIYKGKKVYVLYASKKSGEEEPEDLNRPKLIAYFGFLMMLALPIGGVMLGQGAAVVGAFPSVYLSNQLLASYLAGTQIAETDVVLEQDLLEIQGQAFATGLIGMQLCQSRTVKALFQENAKPGSDFFDPYGWDVFYDIDQEFTNKEVNACLSYHFEGEKVNASDTDAVRRVVLEKGSTYLGRCPGAGFKDYVEEVHGFEHACGEINYSYPGNTEDIDNWDLEDSLTQIQSEFQTSRFFSQFTNEEERLKTIFLSGIRDPAERRKEISDIFDNLSETVIEPRLRESALFNEQDREKLLVQYMYALNSMLGGSVLNGAQWESNNEAVQYVIPGLEDDNEGFRYGVEYLTQYAFNIADLMEEYHCAANWETYAPLRLGIVEYNRADEDMLEDKLADFTQADCMRFVDYSAAGGDPQENDERGRYIGYQTKHDLPFIFADINNEDGYKIIELTPGQKEAHTKTLMEVVADDRYKRAVAKKMVLEGYYTAVKRAFINVLSERLLDEVGSEDMYMISRQKGAAALGALMMNITQNQASGVHFKSMIQQTGTATAYTDANYYLNIEAFGQDGNSKVANVFDAFTPLKTETFFDMGNAALVDPEDASSVDREKSEFNTFMGNVESFIFEPIIHVKKASGIPSDVSLMEGLEDCMNGDSSRCISSASHPIVAMSRFGHHLADNMINLYITHVVVQMINEHIGLISLESKKGGETGVKKMVEWAKKVVKGGAFLITGAITLIAFVLSVMAPFILILFAVGIFFAYILPVLGYLYSMSMVILWLVALGLGSLVLPFYIIVKVFTIERSHKDGFLEFYQTFLSPYVKLLFITIAIVFSYVFMSISLFATNSAFSMLFAGMDALASASVAGFSLSKLIFKLLLYIAYFVSIFVLLTMSIKMIKTLPDLMAKNMKLNGTSDDNFIENMQFESYVQANIVQQISKLPEGAVNNMQTAARARSQSKEIDENIEKIEAFLAKTERPSQGQEKADESRQSRGSKGADEGSFDRGSDDIADENTPRRSGRSRAGSARRDTETGKDLDNDG